MSAYTDGLEQAAENAFCDITRRGVAAGLIFAGLTAETIAGFVGGLAVAGISAHLYASYCGQPPPPPPYGTPQNWTGGQCVGVSYRVAVSFALILNPKTSNVNVGRVGTVFDAIGAISKIEVYDTGDLDNDIRVRSSWNGGSYNESVVKGSNNDVDNPQWGYREIIIAVSRNDNQADTCGNPAPIPPADRFDAPGNITYINRDGDTVNSPVTFNFRAPRIGVNGDVFIPVNVNFNNSPTLNFSGTINLNGGNIIVNPRGGSEPIGNGDDPGNVFIPPGSPPTIPPPPPGTTDPPPGTTPPGVPPDPPPPPDAADPLRKPKVIRGVIVTVLSDDTDATIIFQDETPDIYAPSLGYVSFLCLINGVKCWTADIPVKNRKQIIECPWKFGAIDVRATPKPDGRFQLLKVYDVNSV
jgi:hypothetical protein